MSVSCPARWYCRDEVAPTEFISLRAMPTSPPGLLKRAITSAVEGEACPHDYRKIWGRRGIIGEYATCRYRVLVGGTVAMESH